MVEHWFEFLLGFSFWSFMGEFEVEDLEVLELVS